jgi:adenosylcobyric acid synthase
LTGIKSLAPVSGTTAVADLHDAPFNGYEMHVGQTKGEDCQRPLLNFADGRSDGAVSRDGRIMGCYVHGLFSHTEQRKAWLRRLGGASSGFSYEDRIEESLDALAAHLEAHIDLDLLLSFAR